MILYRTELHSDAFDIENLLDSSFGDDREAKTSYRYREGIERLHDLCMVAVKGGRLVGTIRYWPVLLGGQEVLLLGPVAVDKAEQGNGIGADLIRSSLGKAFRSGYRLVLLAGDPAYYQRFGFKLAHEVGVIMPDEDIQRFQYLALGATQGVPAGFVERAIGIAA